MLLVIIEVVGSDEIADIVAIGGGGPLQAERVVDAVPKLHCLLLVLLMEQLAEDASMAGVLFSHPLGCLLVIYQVLLIGLVVAIMASQDQIIGPLENRLSLTLLHPKLPFSFVLRS